MNAIYYNMVGWLVSRLRISTYINKARCFSLSGKNLLKPKVNVQASFDLYWKSKTCFSSCFFFNFSTFNRISESFEVLHFVFCCCCCFSCAVLIMCMCHTLPIAILSRHDFSIENELSNICSCSCWMSFHIIQAKWIESVDVRMSLTYAINVFTMCICTNLYLISNYLLNWLKI